MLRFRTALFLSCLLAAGASLPAQERLPRFVSSPDVHGGRVVFTGTPAELVASQATLTGRHLADYVG